MKLLVGFLQSFWLNARKFLVWNAIWTAFFIVFKKEGAIANRERADAVAVSGAVRLQNWIVIHFLGFWGRPVARFNKEKGMNVGCDMCERLKIVHRL